MKKMPKTKKLSLTTETVRLLGDDRLAGVIGGATFISGVATCMSARVTCGSACATGVCTETIECPQ